MSEKKFTPPIAMPAVHGERDLFAYANEKRLLELKDLAAHEADQVILGITDKDGFWSEINAIESMGRLRGHLLEKYSSDEVDMILNHGTLYIKERARVRNAQKVTTRFMQKAAEMHRPRSKKK